MRTSITTVTPPALEPVTLAEAKLWMKVDITEDDALITDLIVAAREYAEQSLRRALITQTKKLTLDIPRGGLDDVLGDGVYDLPVSVLVGDLPSVIELPYQPIQSITSVKTFDTDGTESTYSSDNYFLDTAGGRLVLKDGEIWPSGLRAEKACEITYVAGYGSAASSVPASIKSAIKMHVQNMYDNRIVCDAPEACMKIYQKHRIYGTHMR